jgi:hypothetical protein
MNDDGDLSPANGIFLGCLISALIWVVLWAMLS